MDIIRKDTAKHYKQIRKILRGNEPIECSEIEHNEEELLGSIEAQRSAFILFICLILAGIIFFLALGNAHAYTTKDEIKAIIGESEGEPQSGKNAVACAIYNRGNLSGVYGLHAPRVKKHLYSQETYKNAVKAIITAKNQEYCQDLIKGAQYWEGTAFKTPYWAKNMQLTAIIGHQKFYRGTK